MRGPAAACLTIVLSAIVACTSGPAIAGKLTALLDEFAGADCLPDGPASVLFLQTSTETAAIACGTEREGGKRAQAHSRFLIASVSKLYLAVAILQLHEEGTLDIEDEVSRWLPSDVVQAYDGLDGITIAMLLTMTSGLPDYLDDAFFLSSVADAKAGLSDHDILTKAARSVAAEPRLFEPGTAFDYSNTNYLLAQLVLENAAARPMNEIFKTRILAPAGLGATGLLGYDTPPSEFVQGFEDFGRGLEPVDAYLTGYGFGDGGLVSPAADVAAFYKALLIDKTLLGQDTLERLLDDPLGEGYGMGIELETQPDLGAVFGHSGGDTGFSADIRYSSGKDAIVVYVSALADDDLSVTWELLEELP